MSSELVVQDLDRQKLDLIKQTVAKGATDLELDLFMHACKRTGLDPLMKQIYAIKRWNNAERRETMAFQTGIDGYRLIADRTGLYAGSDEPTYTIGKDGFPDVATVTVHKMVGGAPRAFTASARWTEYVQTNKEGKPTSMWVKMPFLMLGKCAEALALRKAFPAELSGVYTHEEMMQADTDAAKPTRDTRSLKEKVQAQARIIGVESAVETVTTYKEEAVEEEGDGIQLLSKKTIAAMTSTAPAPPPAAPVPVGEAMPTASPAPSRFIWQMGKHKDKEIEKLPVDYLIWAVDNISRQDHKDAAREELERRNAEQLFQGEVGEEGN